jgi:hypothetical protein
MSVPSCWWRLLVAVLLLCGAHRACAQGAAGRGEDLSISLLTFGPGEIYWERFGHNAILVRDAASGRAIAYNYGIFDFSQEHFFLNFARGIMRYRIAADPLALDLALYRQEGRWVEEQVLALSPRQRAALRDFLEWNARPENAQYDYDYFRANCSTRVRDALDRALDGALRAQLQPRLTAATYRSDAVRLIWPDRALALGMDLALGPRADRPLDLWQESFVPMVLMRAVREVTVRDAAGARVPLVVSQRRVFESRLPDEPAALPDLRWPFFALGLALAALLTLLRGARGARSSFTLLAALYALLCGVGGVILLAMWAFTQHWASQANQNLLLLDPLYLALLPAVLRSAQAAPAPSARLRRLIGLIAVAVVLAPALKLIPGIPRQDNLHWILLLAPPGLALCLRLARAAAPRR